MTREFDTVQYPWTVMGWTADGKFMKYLVYPDGKTTDMDGKPITVREAGPMTVLCAGAS